MTFPSEPTSELAVVGNVIDAHGTGWPRVERDMLTDSKAIILADAIDGLLANRQPVEVATVAR